MEKFKANFLHLCDSAFFSKENKLNIIGIFDSVTVKKIPGSLLKTTLVGNITVLDKSLTNVKFIVNISNEDGINVYTPPTFEMKIPKSVDKKGKAKIGFILDIGNLKFTKVGKHQVTLSANNEKMGELKFIVNKLEAKK